MDYVLHYYVSYITPQQHSLVGDSCGRDNTDDFENLTMVVIETHWEPVGSGAEGT